MEKTTSRLSRTTRSAAIGGRKTAQKAVPMRAGRHPAVIDTSDRALIALLARLKVAVDLDEVRQLSDQLERLIFHKQFGNA